jgi:ABC transporter transmembrane region
MERAITGPEAGVRGLSGWFWAIGLFGVFANLLMLTGPLYMLQVYDRVLSSRSEATLLALTLLIAALYAIMGLLDYARGRLAARVGSTVQTRLDERVFRTGLRRALGLGERTRPASGLKDLESVQRLLSSPVLFAVFDMPWAPVFLFAIFLFHPWLGWLAIAGGLVLVAVTLLNQWLTRRPEAEANAAAMFSDNFAEVMRQQAETVQALGMTRPALARWQALRRRALAAQLGSSDRIGQFSTFSKTFRFFLQSAMLGLGAYLVLKGEMTAGAMIAASILLGRALAPVEQAIGGWPLVLRARQGSYRFLGLSTGEKSASSIASSVGETRMAGEEARFLDLPVPTGATGVFDRLAEMGKEETAASAAEIADALNRASGEHFGTAAPAFIEYVSGDLKRAESETARLVEQFMVKLEIPGDGWERRIARKFALGYAAGILAIEAGILPWSKILVTKSAAKAYRSARRQLRKEDGDPRALLTALKALATGSEVVDLSASTSEPSVAVVDTAKVLRQGHPGKARILVASDAFGKLGSERDRELLLKELDAAGIFLKPSRYPRVKAHQVRPTKTARRRYFYAFTDQLLDFQWPDFSSGAAGKLAA